MENFNNVFTFTHTRNMGQYSWNNLENKIWYSHKENLSFHTAAYIIIQMFSWNMKKGKLNIFTLYQAE